MGKNSEIFTGCKMNIKLQHAILFIVFCFSFNFFILTISYAKENKPKTLPANRWREIKRLNADSVNVPFLDTMFLTIKAKGGFSYHNKDAFVYKGDYKLIDKEIDFGYAKFLIVTRKPNQMTFKDANSYHLFKIDSSDTLKTIMLPKEEKIDTSFTIEQMIGHWTVYKRTAEKPLDAIDHTVQIKSIIITGPSSNGKLGVIFADADKSDSPSWYIKQLNQNRELVCEGKSNRILKVLKCQRGEIILEDDNLKYFFKQFK